MSDLFSVKTVDPDGRLTEKSVGLDIYRIAQDSNNKGRPTTPLEVFNSMFPTDDVDKRGTPFEQACYNAGLFTAKDKKHGLAPPSLQELRGMKYEINAPGSTMAGIVAPEGTDALKVGGRLLFPITILQWVTSELMLNTATYEGVLAQMVAQTVSVNGALYSTPIIDLTGPRNSRAGAMAQGAEPDLIARISVSDTAKRIKTKSYGLEITDQAMATATLDLVGMALQQFGLGERYHAIQEDLVDCVNGSTEKGITALSSETAQSYDASITSAGVMSHLAYLKWIYKDWMKMGITHILGDLSSYYALERRVGRPTALGDPGTGRANIEMSPQIMGMPTSIGWFTTTDALFGANTIIGIDKNLAIRKVIDVSAEYAAVERFVLSRLQEFRFDYGFRYEPIFHDSRGWKKLTMTV